MRVLRHVAHEVSKNEQEIHLPQWRRTTTLQHLPQLVNNENFISANNTEESEIENTDRSTLEAGYCKLIGARVRYTKLTGWLLEKETILGFLGSAYWRRGREGLCSSPAKLFWLPR